jgi:hypothetical protein
MSILLPKDIPALHDQVKVLDKHVEICKKFIKATDCTRISILVSFIQDGKTHNEILLYDNDNALPVPKEDLYNFFHSLAQTLLVKRLSIHANGKEVDNG